MSEQDVRSNGMTNHERAVNFFGHEDTLPGQLNDQGFHTVLAGKDHFNPSGVRHGSQETVLVAHDRRK